MLTHFQLGSVLVAHDFIALQSSWLILITSSDRWQGVRLIQIRPSIRDRK